MEDNGIKRIARLTKTYINFSIGDIITGCHDSEWETYMPEEDRWSGPWEEMKIFGTDGNLWKIKVHCSKTEFSNPVKIDVWITSESLSGRGTNSNFEIVDWDNTKWKVEIDSRVDDNSAPGFILSRI
jgi:hypothetical protein